MAPGMGRCGDWQICPRFQVTLSGDAASTWFSYEYAFTDENV